MTGPLLAALAAMSGVFGAWEALAVVEQVRPARAVGRALTPLRLAGRVGRAPTAPERRRLAIVGAGTLMAALRLSVRCSPRDSAVGGGHWAMVRPAPRERWPTRSRAATRSMVRSKGSDAPMHFRARPAPSCAPWRTGSRSACRPRRR